MAVQAQPSAEGVPCWTDAMLSDVAAGRRFYGELFGWTFGGNVLGREGCTAYLDGRPAAGLYAKPDGRMPTVWNLHLATGDAVAAVARVREAGGSVLTEPVRAGGGAVTAVAADPSGAVFALLQAGEFAGFGVRDEHGAYVWSEVHVRDKAAVDTFYAEVFGFGMRDLRELAGSGTEQPDGGATEEQQHQQHPEQPERQRRGRESEEEDFMVWAAAGDPVDEEHAIGGRCVIGETWPAQMPAHFLTYFAVDDCDAAVHTALRLSGRVLREPEETPHGTYAVLADDQGASFAVLQTPPAAEAGTAAGTGAGATAGTA